MSLCDRIFSLRSLETINPGPLVMAPPANNINRPPERKPESCSIFKDTSNADPVQCMGRSSYFFSQGSGVSSSIIEVKLSSHSLRGTKKRPMRPDSDGFARTIPPALNCTCKYSATCSIGYSLCPPNKYDLCNSLKPNSHTVTIDPNVTTPTRASSGSKLKDCTMESLRDSNSSIGTEVSMQKKYTGGPALGRFITYSTVVEFGNSSWG
mmetsp:Transcript_36599/g.59860  ORF Transcript_36599/g.59860 Transcript_36599/m.59860 type:complete len:209 (-) Transcript_36599:385-1011(-)